MLISIGALPLGCSALSKGRRGLVRQRRKIAQFCSLKAALPALLVAALCPSVSRAQLQTLPDQEPQRVFTGDARKITVLLRNVGASPVDSDLRTRLYQASSATAAPLGEVPWKKLTVLPGQTVLESAILSFPPAKAETRFLVQWVEGPNKLIGTTEVLAYPPDLLKDLQPLAGEKPLGALDPQNQLKLLLKAAAVECQDLEDIGLENYHSKLAIIGPFQTTSQMRESLASRSVEALAQKGVAVVWIQPPPEKRQQLKPSFYTVREGKGAVVVVQADLVANLAESPQAQLNLIRFARLALHPEPPRLPDLTPSQ
jgi:hypothetical protein